MLGLKPKEFYSMSFYDFYLLEKGYRDKQKESISHTRQICWVIYKSNADPKTAARTIDEYWPIVKDTSLSKKEDTARNKRIQKTLKFIKKL